MDKSYLCTETNSFCLHCLWRRMQIFLSHIKFTTVSDVSEWGTFFLELMVVQDLAVRNCMWRHDLQRLTGFVISEEFKSEHEKPRSHQASQQKTNCRHKWTKVLNKWRWWHLNAAHLLVVCVAVLGTYSSAITETLSAWDFFLLDHIK